MYFIQYKNSYVTDLTRQQLGLHLNKMIIIFNVVYVQIVKVSDYSMDVY